MRTGLERKSIAFVLGTRPEMIKIAPLVRLLGDAARVIHTGQHYDNNLSEQFLAELKPRSARLPARRRRPDARQPDRRGHDPARGPLPRGAAGRDRGARRHQRHRGRLAGGQRPAASRSSTSRPGCAASTASMPEEHNRVVADHLADLCLAPTEVNRANLAAEGIGGDKVMLTGNTVVDAVIDLLPDRRSAGRRAAPPRGDARRRSCSAPSTAPRTSTTPRRWPSSCPSSAGSPSR